MNLRCFYCQTPFTLGRAEILSALQRMDSENMNHYDAHCPRCRRANSVSRQRLEMFLPNWREAAAEEAAMPPVPASNQEQTATPSMTVALPAIPVVEPAQAPAPRAAKPARKRAGATKKATAEAAKTTKAKPSQTAKKSAVTKAKPAAKSTAKPAAKPKLVVKKKNK